MSKPKVAPYSAEFKERAVKLALETDQTVAQTARDLAINENTLHTWLSKYHQGGSRTSSQLDSAHLYDELKRLKKENALLREERDILKKGSSVLCRDLPVKYAWMKQQSDHFKVSAMCQALEVSRSGYYEWLTRPSSAHAQKDQVLSERIKEHFEVNRCVYGTRRLKACLAEDGEHVSRRRIGRLMAQQNLQVKTRRKFKVTTDSHHGQAVAPHVLERHFGVKTPDTAYVGDITYIWTAQGWLYLAVVIDLFSRAVVGWSMSPWLKAELVTHALQMALDRRQPKAGLLMHTDRGSQYVADGYLRLLHRYGIEASMSRTGNCWDNAVAESFFHTLKTECVYLQRFETREQAQTVIFDYVEVFYNRQRRHSSNGNMAPMVYERIQKAA